MLEIISVDLSRIRQYVDDLQACRETTKLSRSELENRISHSMGDIPPCHLESFFEWLENIYALERVDCANKESLMRFLRLAQRAKHDYLDLLNAAFRSDVGHLEKWLLIIFKLGRYGIASRAFFQLAMELPALFSPMVVESVPAPGKISVKNNEVDLGLALRRLFGTKEEEYIGRLSHIWNRKGDPRNYFSQQCPAHLTVHAELQLVGFYDENPQRMPSLRFIGVSKKSCYLCNRFLAIHPLAFRTSACHQKLYPASAPPFTVDSKTYDSYKSIAIKLTEMMEATIKQELDHRPKFLHKLVPPDSSAGVSLSGITESGSAPVMSGALVESLVGKKRLLQHSSLMRDCQLEQTEDFESLCISTRSPPSIPQAAETSEPGYGNLSFSRGGAVSMYRELPDRVMDVVLHVERANDSLKQETIRIAELLDVGTQQPSWEILVETLKLEGDFSIDFRTESDVLVVENHIIVENERQLLACLQRVSTCQAATTNWQGMMALRFLMGMSEASFGPGVPYLLSFFYRRHELGFRCGLFVSAAPLANTFAGVLAYGITSGHPTLASWRVLFLVEGLPVCASALLAWFFVPDSPATARFLTEEEKEVARARSMQQTGEPERSNKIEWNELFLTLLDAKAWLTALMYFSCNVSYSSLPVFLPTILNQMGFTAINAQGLTAPPFFVSFLVTIATTWLADRIQQRGLVIAGLSLMAGVGYILLATSTSVGVRYFGVFLAASGVFPSIANILPWVLNNQGSDTRRGGGIILLNVIGQCGPFLGTNVFPDAEAPRFVKGLSISAAFMFFTALSALGLRFLLVWDNRCLDKKYGAQVEEDPTKPVDMPVAQENYGAGFRYVL
ncbi:hypothetical protein N7486_011104 [Penicillium sp. IBT 16267x]|nr:hypothetical protein N7486_011104 [Penicillium sp. IBT 16267x]